MKYAASLALAAFLSANSSALAITSVPVVSESSSVVAGTEKEICEKIPKATPPPAEKTAIPATVTGIDQARGVLNLETKVGRAQVTTPPQMLQVLQVGDKVELCTVDEEPSENLLQDSVIT